MKKHQPRARKLRKCERGIKTKNGFKPCRYLGWKPVGWWFHGWGY